MINACKNRFSDFSSNTLFEVCDVRNMKMFSDSTFDFILFSFNGIDYISHQERIESFKEILRVGKPGGYFCFSTHNLNSIQRIFGIKYLLNMPIVRIRLYFRKMAKAVLKIAKKIVGRNISGRNVKLVKTILSVPDIDYSINFSWYKWFLFRYVHNRNIKVKDIKSSPFLVLTDDAHDFGLQTHYSQPLEQIKELNDFCKEVHVYSLITGDEIKDIEQLIEISDPWLYYLCVFK